MTTSRAEDPDGALSIATPPFVGAALDRGDLVRKDPEQIAALLADSRAVALVASADGVLVTDGEAPELARPLIAGNHDAHLDPAATVLLGLELGTPLFALDLERVDAERRARLLRGGRLVPLREAAGLLSPTEGGLAAYLAALVGWHRRSGFCANCGSPTEIGEGGLVRHCPSCGASHFPRTDPVVIMLVENRGRILLGSRTGWPDERYSVLAGFVAPGETPEEAVVREVAEESGITVHDPVYVGAQPWPFPHSLMLGFHAQAEDGEPVVGDGELASVRWATLDEVRAAQQEAGAFHLPGAVSIARQLIDGWVLSRS